ncbi:hypothetical protein [Mycoplasma sp. Z386]
MILRWYKNGNENDCERFKSGIYSEIVKWLKEKKVIPYNFEDFNQKHMDNIMKLLSDYDSPKGVDYRVIKPVEDELHTIELMIDRDKFGELFYCKTEVTNIWSNISAEIDELMNNISDETLKEKLKPFQDKLKEELFYWLDYFENRRQLGK